MASWPGMNGTLGLSGPVAVRGVEIRVADPAGFGLDQDLTGTGRRNIDFAEHEGFAELFDDGGVHLCGSFFNLQLFEGVVASG